MEIWKDIKGLEGFYQVSNKGRVKSICVKRCINGKYYFIKRERILASCSNGKGYKVAFMQKDRKRIQSGIHRLVAEAFLEKPDGCNVVNHKDYNRENNCVENLEWCTTQYNVEYSKGRKKPIRPKAPMSNTGERYISKHKYGYSVYQPHLREGKNFHDFDKALEYVAEEIRRYVAEFLK